MAKNEYNEAYFLNKGYVSDGKGGFNPPKFRNPLTTPESKATTDVIIPKQKVNNSPDFEVTPKLKWFIPYQVPSKKNCQQLYIKRTQGGKMIPATTTSQRYKDYVNLTKNYWETFGKEFKNSVLKMNICPPYQIEFTFIRSTKQKVDYVGPLESCQDIMQDFKWMENDDAYTMKPHLGDIEVDNNNPGVKIRLICK